MSEVKTKQRAVAALESMLIQHLRLGDGVSRIELAREMDLAPSTIGLYVDRLIADGFLREGLKSPRNAGRPPIILELNPQAGQFVGVDFEARQLTATAVDFSQQTLERRQETIRSSDAVDGVLKKIQRAISNVVGRKRRLLGIGIGVPGSVDTKRGIAVHYEFIRGWRDVPLVDRLSHEFKVPIYLENNIRAMALAERWFGQAREVDNFVCLGVRSGIGAGVMIQGELYRGKNNLAGEIGAWSCPPEGRRHEDQFVTLEQAASVPAILRQVTEGALAGRTTSLSVKPDKPVTQEELFEAARRHDPLVEEVLQATGRTVGHVISQFNLLLNPELVVISGPLAELGNLFLDSIRETVESLVPEMHGQMPRIVASQLGQFGGALGAAAMAVHQWKPAR